MGVRGRPTKWDRWYSTPRWARIRRQQLLAHPLCKFCLKRGIVTPATICDYVEPHRGDVNTFWLGPFESLCKECHRREHRFRPISAWMGGRSTRIIQSIGRREAGHLYGFGRNPVKPRRLTWCRPRDRGRSLAGATMLRFCEPGEIPG